MLLKNSKEKDYNFFFLNSLTILTVKNYLCLILNIFCWNLLPIPLVRSSEGMENKLTTVLQMRTLHQLQMLVAYYWHFFQKMSILTLTVVTYCQVFNHLFLPLHSCVYLLTVGTYLVSVKLKALLLHFSWWRKTNQIIPLPSFLPNSHLRRLKTPLFPLELVIQLMS